MTKRVIRLWFNEAYNLYFPKTAKDCQALFESGWTNIPCFAPPNSVRPGLHSINTLYGFLESQAPGTEFHLQLGNYLPSHITKPTYHKSPQEQEEKAHSLPPNNVT